MGRQLRVAAITTVYYPASHADVIISKFLKGWSIDEGFITPEVDLVSLYIDQIPETDIGLDLAKKYGVRVYPSIRQALFAGCSTMEIDAVLLIGEHGDYPWNERGRQIYPRRHFFEQITGVFAECKRSVPVFSDKHFAYDYSDAQWIWDRVKQLKIPLMAGSSLPLAWRNPWVEYNIGVDIGEAIVVGFGGVESYGFHALEALLCMVERRQGGETGIASVQCLEGNKMWQSFDEKGWSSELMDAALGSIKEKPAGSIKENTEAPTAFLLEHNDGLRTTVLMLGGYIRRFAYAAQVDGRVHWSRFDLVEGGTYAHFGYLCHNIQKFFQTGIAPYPPDRTLLATGVIDAAMNSRYEDNREIKTTWLDIKYSSYTEMPFRPVAAHPMGESINPEAPDRTGHI